MLRDIEKTLDRDLPARGGGLLEECCDLEAVDVGQLSQAKAMMLVHTSVTIKQFARNLLWIFAGRSISSAGFCVRDRR